MSIMCIHKDFIRCEGITIYHRAVVFLYTRIGRQALCNYVGKLELYAADRQNKFFKTDVEILEAPSEMELKQWYIAVIILKSEHEQSMQMLVNLFCQSYPHDLHFNYYNEQKGKLLCSADTKGQKIQLLDVEAYKKLSKYYANMQSNVVELSKKYRNEDPLHSIDVLIKLANDYKVFGGHWMFLFPPLLKNSDKEKIFDYILYCFSSHPSMLKQCVRFSAKMSQDHINLSLGVPYTKAAVDSSIMVHAGCGLNYKRGSNDLKSGCSHYPSSELKKKFKSSFYSLSECNSWRHIANVTPAQQSADSEKPFIANTPNTYKGNFISDKEDPLPFALRQAIDSAYKPHVFGRFQIKFKLDVASHCCIQRNDVIRPTVYARLYIPNNYRARCSANDELRPKFSNYESSESWTFRR